MGDDDRVSNDLDDRLSEVTEDLWTRRETDQAVAEAEGAPVLTGGVSLTDEDIAAKDGASLPVVRAWLDAEDGDELVVERDGDTRVVKALLDD